MCKQAGRWRSTLVSRVFVLVFSCASLLCVASSASAELIQTCTYEWVDQGTTYVHHPEVDIYIEGTGWIMVAPPYDEVIVEGYWQESCSWDFTLVPIPPPQPPPPDPVTPVVPIIRAAAIWLIDVDVSTPTSVTADVGVRGASDTSCDFDHVALYLGVVENSEVDAIPYSFRIGNIRLDSLPANTTTYADIIATSPCGDSDTTGFLINRSSGSFSQGGGFTAVYLDQQNNAIVPVAHNFTRTLTQDTVDTSFDVTTIGGYHFVHQITSSTDSVQFGPSAFLPGTPLLTDTWSAVGTTLGTVNERMGLSGWDSSGKVLTYSRPQMYSPLWGRWATITASISQFQWFTNDGLVMCFTLGNDLSLTFP
jgi:hypothetical protein